LQFSVDRPTYFHGILVFTGEDKDILDLSVPVVFERVTSKLTLNLGEHLITQQTSITTIQEARKNVKEKGHIKNIDSLLLEAPVYLQRDSWYDLELNIFPTDVTNHYSGYPITTCGAEIWTVFGENGESEYQCCGTIFRFQESAKSGRSCFLEGQIPGILFSPVY